MGLKILSFKPDLLTIPYVIEDALDSLRRLGHTTRLLDLHRAEKEPRKYAMRLIEELNDFRPDFIFSVDHLGVAPRIFSQLKIPYASWFIDEPKRCLDPLQGLDKEELTQYCLPFVCDRAYIEELKGSGFKEVLYLPLAANSSIFKEMRLSKKDENKYKCNISFAGGSDITHYRRHCLELKEEKIQVLIDEIINCHIQRPEEDITCILEEIQKRFPYTLSFKDDSHKKAVLLGLEFAAMTKFRKEV
ncbi:TPA: hypothetical protein DCX15_02625, partial [bacterium]|nr:hypothetical protein [bacterium]